MRPFLLCLLLLVGCAKTVTAPIPGSINSFDSTSYQILSTAHGIAQSLSSQACSNNGNLPNCFTPTTTQKNVINAFISDLNVADLVYSAYHNGTATQAQVTSAIQKVQTDQASLPTSITSAVK